ncbi:MAG: ABC transporter permease subunit [Phycisphaerales bacterium]
MIHSIIQLVPRGLFGPVFDREIRVVSRHVSSFWVRALYTLGLAALATLVYFVMTVEIRFNNSGRASSLQQLQMFAPTVGAFFAWFQFVIMCFVASTLTAGSICDERRKGSLSSLLATPLSPAQIVLGKFSGRLVQLIILIAAGMPLLLAVRLFGGISPGFIISATILTMTTAFVHASIALAASARVRSSTTAASSGFVTGVVWCFAPMILTLLLSIGSNGPRTYRIMPLSPYFSLGMETAASFGATNMPMFGAGDWLYAAAYNVFGCILFLWIAAARLRKIALTGGESLPARAPKKRALAAIAASAGGVTRAASDDLTVSDNPLQWRELRQRMFIRRWHPWVVVICTSLLLAYVYRESGIHESGVFYAISAISLALLFFQASLIAANSIAGERESRSLEVLLTTPLTARKIIFAKWLGALRRVSPIAILYFAIALCCAVLPGTFHFVLLVHLLLIIVPPILFMVATGVWLSVVSKRSTVAATLNLAISLVLWVGVPMVILSVASMFRQFAHAPPPDEWLGVLFIWNPAPMVVTAIQGAIYGPWDQIGAGNYRSFIHFDFWTFTATTVGFAGLYCLLARMALRGAAGSLARRTNRAG